MVAEYYSNNPKFHVAVDCVIFGFEDNRLKVLLQRRDFEPFSGELSLMGGFVQEGEDVKAAALRVLEERTGISQVFIKQVGAFGKADRDPGAQVISVAYTCLLDKALCNDELNREHNGFWANVNELPKLNFGHDDMVRKALYQLRLEIGKSPIGFSLLPPSFTLTQLQTLHECILGEPIDKRNFRKRVSEWSFIEKTGEIDKIHSKRGAALFRYNKDEYDRLNKLKL